MALKLIRERSTGLYLSADFETTTFADAERTADDNEATWLSTTFEKDAAILAGVALVGDQFEVVDLHDCACE